MDMHRLRECRDTQTDHTVETDYLYMEGHSLALMWWFIGWLQCGDAQTDHIWRHRLSISAGKSLEVHRLAT